MAGISDAPARRRAGPRTTSDRTVCRARHGARAPTPPKPYRGGHADGAISAFWAAALFVALPRRRPLRPAILASAAIGLPDLRVIAPRFFPEVARLPFWPQMADHLMWGACLGGTLALRGRS
jgi:hypothetical protein